METKKINKHLYLTAFVLYMNYFVHGIGASILGQYKQDFAQRWGASLLENGTYDVSSVIYVIAALGLGRLIALPFAGPLSDRLGRKASIYIGIFSYILYFVGIALSPTMKVGYMFALAGGIANSFLDTGVIPAVMEIFEGATGFASILTKLFISVAQFLLPFMLGYVAANNLPYTTLFYAMAILIGTVGIVLIFMPMPEASVGAIKDPNKKPLFEQIKSMKFTPVSVALIVIGFTCTATFQLWLNCNQEFARMAGVETPSIIQSYYSMGSIIAVLLTAVLLSKSKLKSVRFVLVYPIIALVMLILVYIIQTPAICMIGGFVIGFAAAGGVLQLAVATVNDLFPETRGTITSIIMIASSLSNYTIISLAGKLTSIGGVDGPKNVLMLNIVVTTIGVILALFVNANYDKEIKKRALQK